MLNIGFIPGIQHHPSDIRGLKEACGDFVAIEHLGRPSFNEGEDTFKTWDAKVDAHYAKISAHCDLIIGHSRGCRIALRVLENKNFPGLVLLNPPAKRSRPTEKNAETMLGTNAEALLSPLIGTLTPTQRRSLLLRHAMTSNGDYPRMLAELKLHSRESDINETIEVMSERTSMLIIDSLYDHWYVPIEPKPSIKIITSGDKLDPRGHYDFVGHPEEIAEHIRAYCKELGLLT